jgi:CRP-like cAMP-binding protein
MGLLGDAPRSASVLAEMPTLVLELDCDAFTEVINRHPETLSNMLQTDTQRPQRGASRHRLDPTVRVFKLAQFLPR